jgi:hypothetical protein
MVLLEGLAKAWPAATERAVALASLAAVALPAWRTVPVAVLVSPVRVPPA